MIAVLLAVCVSTQAHAACRPGTDSTTLDVSNDLRSLPADPPFQQNMKPGNPHFDFTAILNRAIAYAAANGCTKIVGDAGDYYFRNPYSDGTNQQPWYILLDRAKNLSVEFPGSTFIFTQPAYTAFRAQHCRNCVLKGMAIDYSILPFTQLTVTGIDGKTGQVIAAPLPGYPDLSQFTRRPDPHKPEFVAFDLRQNVIQYAVGGTKWTTPPPTWTQGNRITFGALSAYVQKGDTLILSARGGGPAIFVVYSQQVTIDGVTIYTSAGPGIEVKASSDVTIDHMVIEPRPNTGRLADVVAGGIQLNDMGQNIAVRQSTIVSAQDDSIAGNVPPGVPVLDLNLVVAGNTITNSYFARGIAFTSVEGAHITQNKIDGTQQAGIYVGGANSKLRPQPVSQVQITNNVLTNTNVGPDSVGLDMLGAIEVMYYYDQHTVTDAPNRDIFINDNTIDTTLRSGIWVGNVTGGAVKQNTVQNYGLSKGALGNADHLNNGLRPCASPLFTQATVNWYSQDVDGIGTALPVCSSK